jgi:hypothetical protein
VRSLGMRRASRFVAPVRTILRGSALLVWLVAVPAAQARSRGRHRRLDAFVEGGGSFFVPQTSSNFFGFPAAPPYGPEVGYVTAKVQDSGRFFVGADFWLGRHDAVQVGYSYSPADVTTTFILVEPAPGSQSQSPPSGIHILSFDYVHAFSLSKRWRLFLDAGIGRVWWNSHYTLYTGGLAGNLGTGVSFRITSHWSARAEYKDCILRLPTEPFVGGLVHDNSPTIGIAYHF